MPIEYEKMKEDLVKEQLWNGQLVGELLRNMRNAAARFGPQEVLLNQCFHHGPICQYVDATLFTRSTSASKHFENGRRGRQAQESAEHHPLHLWFAMCEEQAERFYVTYQYSKLTTKKRRSLLELHATLLCPTQRSPCLQSDSKALQNARIEGSVKSIFPIGSTSSY